MWSFCCCCRRTACRLGLTRDGIVFLFKAGLPKWKASWTTCCASPCEDVCVFSHPRIVMLWDHRWGERNSRGYGAGNILATIWSRILIILFRQLESWRKLATMTSLIMLNILTNLLEWCSNCIRMWCYNLVQQSIEANSPSSELFLLRLYYIFHEMI